MTPTLRLAVIGDVHRAWDEDDVSYFGASEYDAVLFVGDLGKYRPGAALRVARSIAPLGRRAIVIPGNHDATHVGQLIAEAIRSRVLQAAFGAHQGRRCRELRAALGEATMAGYSLHDLESGGRGVTVVAARPHSMGGPTIAFRRYLRAEFGVDSVAASAARLASLVDRATHRDLLFLAHNGPAGLGSGREDPWGCDFRRAEGDFGDPDLTLAVAHAGRSGRRVLAVVAGHMHHRLDGGGARQWCRRRNGTLYVNAARVPRISRRRGEVLRHHVAVRVGEEVTADEVLVRQFPARPRGTRGSSIP